MLGNVNQKQNRMNVEKTPCLPGGFCWWALRDSNPRPLPCKGRMGGSLTRENVCLAN